MTGSRALPSALGLAPALSVPVLLGSLPACVREVLLIV